MPKNLFKAKIKRDQNWEPSKRPKTKNLVKGPKLKTQ